MIRVFGSGTVSQVEHKTFNGKELANFRLEDSGLSLKAVAWGELAAQVQDGARVLVEGSLKGRAYKAEGKDRVSQELTCSVIEQLSGGAPADDEDLFS